VPTLVLHSRTNTGNATFANFAISERQPLLARATAALENCDEQTLGPVDRNRPVAGGTVLGIHNLAIVLPQFIVRRFSIPFLESGVLNVWFVGFACYQPYLQDCRWE
jgi:hypothetical protein